MRSLLGGKGANLAEMTRIGLPVPDGFTITTEACVASSARAARAGRAWTSEVAAHLAALEQRTGSSSARRTTRCWSRCARARCVSMPGMMDTILNLGINDESVRGPGARPAAASGSPTTPTAGSCRCSATWSAGVDGHLFEDALQRAQAGARRATHDVELDADDLRAAGRRVPGDLRARRPGERLPAGPAGAAAPRSIDAVFGSWNTPRARTYRREYHIADDLGTAVNVVQMVFGNMGDDSATGVASRATRRPASRELYGEYLLNAQGEDVVAGIRTPQPLAELEDEHARRASRS